MGAAVICTLQISIYRTLNRYRAGLGKSDNLPMFVRNCLRPLAAKFQFVGRLFYESEGQQQKHTDDPKQSI